jgi:glycosyltransferase involved in cell wall biosynthesis
MRDLSNQPLLPAVTVIMPTYNRARFLLQAFESIRAQTFTNWELIIVDDGSTDDTEEVVRRLTVGWPQPVRYIRQENRGAYGARNTGLDHANGEYIAFYDSDDVWLAHHLAHCVAALRRRPEVDWVYGACRSVDYRTGRVLTPNTFYVGGRARAFLRLRARPDGALRIIEDPDALRCMLESGMFCGLQNSVIRRGVFASYRFEAASRNEAEDQLIVVEALAADRRLGYFDDVHVIYHVHPDNSSAAGPGSIEKQVRVFRAMAEGYETLRGRVVLSPMEKRSLDRRLSRAYFWGLGYVLLRQRGREAEALAFLRRGMGLWPSNPRYWKTYFLSWLRVRLGRAVQRAPDAARPGRAG